MTDTDRGIFNPVFWKHVEGNIIIRYKTGCSFFQYYKKISHTQNKFDDSPTSLCCNTVRVLSPQDVAACSAKYLWRKVNLKLGSVSEFPGRQEQATIFRCGITGRILKIE